MKKVRCVSPHGGCHNGMYPDGRPVMATPDGKIPQPERLYLEPNEGGYIDDARIRGRFAAVGQEYDVGDDFYADGFHWVEAATGEATVIPGDSMPPDPPATPTPQAKTPPPEEK